MKQYFFHYSNFNFRHYLKKSRIIILLFLFCFSLQGVSQTYISAPDDLQDSVNAAIGGDIFIIPNGTYNDFEASFEKMATEDKPITIKAETVGGVILTGSSHFTFKKSAYITLEGFVINGTDDQTLVKLEGCNNIRITRNVFELATTKSVKWVYIGGVYDDTSYPFQYPSHHNRIDHNLFQNKTTPGQYITIDGSTDEATDQAYQSQFDRIDHNYFKNNGPRAVNEQESIRIGWSEMSMSSGYTILEYNLFEDCDGDPEIVSVKSCDNIIRHNTFIRNYGTLSLRHGNRNRVEGNYFFGGGKEIGLSPDSAKLYTGGIRIYGKGHIIINNYMEGLNGTKWDAPITLTLGDAIDGQSSSLSKHFRAEDVTIAYNTLVNNSHGIEIGFDNNGSYSKDLSNITIANNLITGSENSLIEIKDDNDQGTNITWLNNLMYPTGTATLLAGATSTSFDSGEVINKNPYLTYNTTSGVWKSTAQTPVIENAVVSENVVQDIEGQSRPNASNPGADHYSLDSVKYAPITSNDVGPDAYEVDDISESLYLSSPGIFPSSDSTQSIKVTSNVNWVVTVDSSSISWISVSPSSGTNNGSFDITVAKNTSYSQRTGTITVTGGELIRTLTVTQEAANPKEGLTLINDAGSNDHVTVIYAFKEEVTETKNNIAAHALDKDFNTQWSGEGVPGEIIFDLGGAYDLQLVDYASTNGKRYEFQIWVSSTDTAANSFTNAFPDSGNLVCETQNDEFTSFRLPEVAKGTKYVKIIGYGQPARPSDWNTITEIEFYRTGDSTSAVENRSKNQLLIYPNPAEQVLHIKTNGSFINHIKIFGIDGRKVYEKTVNNFSSDFNLDVSNLKNGTYLINLMNEKKTSQSKIFIISH